ncbi:MAG: hypothetical protein ACP5TE_13570, partial [Verrucomicrobiia bacterium]
SKGEWLSNLTKRCCACLRRLNTALHITEFHIFWRAAAAMPPLIFVMMVLPLIWLLRVIVAY